jgi:hypothetical protein
MAVIDTCLHLSPCGIQLRPADSHQTPSTPSAAEAGDAGDFRTGVCSGQTAADADESAAPAPEQAARDTSAVPASDDMIAAADASNLEAPPDVALHDAVPPLPEVQQPSTGGQQLPTANSVSVSRLSPAYSRQSTGGSSGWTSDFERSTLPVTQSLSYRSVRRGKNEGSRRQGDGYHQSLVERSAVWHLTALLQGPAEGGGAASRVCQRP